MSGNEIIPNLWLGDINSADDKFIIDNKITCIINCTETLPFSNIRHIKNRIRVPIKDNLEGDEIFKMYTLLDKGANLIDKLIRNNIILIHCYAGKQRSVAIVLAYLMKYGNFKLQEALDTLKTKRIIAHGLHFSKALIQYQQDLALEP